MLESASECSGIVTVILQYYIYYLILIVKIILIADQAFLKAINEYKLKHGIKENFHTNKIFILMPNVTKVRDLCSGYM